MFVLLFSVGNAAVVALDTLLRTSCLAWTTVGNELSRTVLQHKNATSSLSITQDEARVGREQLGAYSLER